MVLVRVLESLNDGSTGARVVGGGQESLAGDVVSVSDWVATIVLDVDGLTYS